jgi:hypothetical protein
VVRLAGRLGAASTSRRLCRPIDIAMAERYDGRAFEDDVTG